MKFEQIYPNSVAAAAPPKKNRPPPIYPELFEGSLNVSEKTAKEPEKERRLELSWCANCKLFY
jgi:hypothetical protein